MDKKVKNKNNLKSSLKNIPKEYFTKIIFSKSKKNNNSNKHLINISKEKSNYIKLSMRNYKKTNKRIKSGIKNDNKNSNIPSFEEKRIVKNNQKKNIKSYFNSSKNQQFYDNFIIFNDIEENKYENEINSKMSKYNYNGQIERKSIVVKNKNLNNNEYNKLSNNNLLKNNDEFLYLENQNFYHKNKISFYFNEKIEKIEGDESHSLHSSFVDNNFEKDIVIKNNNNKTQENKIENYFLIPCNKCSKLVNINEIDEHFNNCFTKIKPKIMIPNNINKERNKKNIFEIKDYSFGEMITDSETKEFLDLKKMEKILDEKRNFKMQKLDNFINEEKNKRLFLMEVLKVKYQKININKNNENISPDIPDILIWKEAEKKKIEKSNWSNFIFDELNNPNKYLKIIQNEKRCK